jgi:hypothetical protein
MMSDVVEIVKCLTGATILRGTDRSVGKRIEWNFDPISRFRPIALSAGGRSHRGVGIVVSGILGIDRVPGDPDIA